MTTALCFMLWRFHHEHRTRGMSHHRFGSRTENDSAEASPAMRRNDNQVNFTFFRNAHNLGSRFTVNHQLLDLEPRAFLTFSEFRQLAFRRVFELFGDVRDGQRFRHSRITDRRHDRLDNVDADY